MIEKSLRLTPSVRDEEWHGHFAAIKSEVNDAVNAVAGGLQQRILELEDEQKKMEHSLTKGLETLEKSILDRLDRMDGTRAGGGSPGRNPRRSAK
jgi:hypothetical protein